MSIFVDAQTDAADLAELVNGDGLVTTRYGDNPKRSWGYMEGEFDDLLSGFTVQGDIAINAINDDVSTVNNAKSSAMSSINGYVSTVEGYSVTAKSNIDDSVESVSDYAITSKSAMDMDVLTVDKAKDAALVSIEADRKTVEIAADSVGEIIDELTTNFNLTPAFDFADGFTIETRNQAGKDASGNYWIYNGSLPYTVSAGTTPSEPDYKQVVFNSGENIATDDGTLDKSLKIRTTDEALLSDRFVGYFDEGFVYASSSELAKGQDGNYYKYIGASSFPVTITAGTIPSTSPASYEKVEIANHSNLADRNIEDAHDYTSIKRFTTEGLIAGNFDNVSEGREVTTVGFSNVFDGGNFSWVKTSGVDTPSQSPLDFGEAKLTDASGSVWVPAIKGVVFVEIFGAPSLETVKIAIDYADNSGATSVRSAFKSSFEISDTLEIVCSDLSILLDYSMELGSSSGDSVVTIHSSSNVDLWIRDIVGNRATSSAGDGFVGANGVIVTNSENVTVRKSIIRSVLNQGLVFTGNSTGAAGGVAAANIGPVSKCYAYDNTITDIGNGALIFQTGEIGVATGNTCELFENEGIQFIDEWDSGLAHDNTIVSGSSAAIALEQHSGRGVSSPVKNIIITNNNIKSDWHGIVFEHNAGEFNDVIIDSNVINLNSSSGLSLGGIITTNAGVMIDNVVITNNVITGVTGSKLNFGVRLYKPGDNSGYAENVIINDNVMEFLEGGIFVSGGDSNDALTVTGNRIANASIAISVDDRSGAVINNNHISLCNDTFIRIGATLGNNVRGISISNNSLSVPNSALTDGILIDNSGSGNISEYQVKNNYVNVSAATSATPINDLVGSGTAQIYGNITLPETSSSFAADKKVTVDQIDSDTDKVLSVGYASLGANLLATADPDDVSQTYKSRVSSTATGIAKMPNTGFWALDSSVYDSNSGHQLAKDIFNRSMFHRSKSSGSWDADWLEIYDSGNTNFSEFGGGGGDDWIAHGWTRSVINCYVVLPINSKTPPTSITVEGTFKIINRTGNTVISSGISDIIMRPQSSNKAVFLQVNPLDSVPADEPIILSTDSSDAKITVNY